ncbi:hypothetical protein [Alkaliphilus metalliredigens]|nr:hypothetical protein [Alkaliphilus metalliredigens]
MKGLSNQNTHIKSMSTKTENAFDDRKCNLKWNINRDGEKGIIIEVTVY